MKDDAVTSTLVPSNVDAKARTFRNESVHERNDYSLYVEQIINHDLHW